MMEDDDLIEDEGIREESRTAARGALSKRWSLEKHDNHNGSIAWEIWTADSHHRVCRIVNDDNPSAMRDAKHIVELHNAMFDQKPATVA